MTRNTKRNIKRKFDLLLFDLGATLLYFDSEFVRIKPIADEALFQQLTNLGYRVDKESLAKRLFDLENSAFDERVVDLHERTTDSILRSTLEQVGLNDITDAHIKIAIHTMLNVYESHWQLGDDTLATLKELDAQGYAMCIISNASDYDNVVRLMEKGSLYEYFDLTLVSAKEGLRKPHPDMFQKALAYFKLPVERAIMIGDTVDADIKGAKEIGMKSIWINRWADNFQNRAHLSHITPDATISRLAELPSRLSNWK